MCDPLVVIGNGMAATRFVEELSMRTLGRYAVAVIGEEPQLAYNRVLLSSLLARDVSAADIELKTQDWWRDQGVTLLYGQPVVAIDAARREVRLADGTVLPYAKLALATGSRPIRLALPGKSLPGVLTFRDLSDIAAIEAAAARGAHAVVIGGGLLGLEAAYGLVRAGVQVTLLHLMDRLMERQLDARAAEMLKRAVEMKGISVLLQAETTAILGKDEVTAVELKDGRRLEADLVVMAVGVRPNVDLARSAGLDIERGILIDDRLTTSDPDIYAIGECAQHHGQCYGLVEPANEQAKVLASLLAGGQVIYGGSVPATNLKVSGVDVFSAGDFMGAAGTEQIILSDPGLDTYKKLVIADGRLVGAVLYGDTMDGLWYSDLIRSGVPVEPFRSDLIFGRALAMPTAA